MDGNYIWTNFPSFIHYKWKKQEKIQLQENKQKQKEIYKMKTEKWKIKIMWKFWTLTNHGLVDGSYRLWPSEALPLDGKLYLAHQSSI